MEQYKKFAEFVLCVFEYEREREKERRRKREARREEGGKDLKN